MTHVLTAVGCLGSPRRKLRTSPPDTEAISASEGVPNTLKITESWSTEPEPEWRCLVDWAGDMGTQCPPGKNASRALTGTADPSCISNNSAKTQPTDQISTAKLYRCNKITSGDLYHRVTTCSVNKHFLAKLAFSTGVMVCSVGIKGNRGIFNAVFFGTDGTLALDGSSP